MRPRAIITMKSLSPSLLYQISDRNNISLLFLYNNIAYQHFFSHYQLNISSVSRIIYKCAPKKFILYNYLFLLTSLISTSSFLEQKTLT
ncbi:hypothetical protein Patl1_00288 [Pistacia atlantica]|uniref:Uncharacterized protein n=1 Tax=Pistacia atlantica TaxID=434234 RepID=A0ACC1C6X4_9ROSI|nr:hypothetical protein Patl1_00288 [Pistacia atlantica]